MLKDYWIQQGTGVSVKMNKLLCDEGACCGQSL